MRFFLVTIFLFSSFFIQANGMNQQTIDLCESTKDWYKCISRRYPNTDFCHNSKTRADRRLASNQRISNRIIKTKLRLGMKDDVERYIKGLKKHSSVTRKLSAIMEETTKRVMHCKSKNKKMSYCLKYAHRRAISKINNVCYNSTRRTESI